VAASTAGDSFTFSTMLGMRHIDWVQSMLVPWIVFFVLAAVASAFSILSKLHFFVGKMRSNFARRSHLSSSAVTVNDALAQNDFNTRKIYAYAYTCTAARASVRRRASTKPHGAFNRYTVVGLCEESVSPRWRGPQLAFPLRFCRCDDIPTVVAAGSIAALGVSARTALFATSRR
jgi:hypothetical protein